MKTYRSILLLRNHNGLLGFAGSFDQDSSFYTPRRSLPKLVRPA